MAYEARMMRVSVSKMHGARNDFVILDQRQRRIMDTFEFARWVCNRRAGVGADGLIVLERSERADARMRTINPDGSEAEMCGNGIRCASRWLDEANEGEKISFETEAGIVRTEIVQRGPEYLVRVEMPRPRVERRTIAGIGEVFFVDVGNPHVVAFVDAVDDIDLASLAAQIGQNANVHAATILDTTTLAARHWERGVGATMACGTGAVACAAAAFESQRVLFPVEVRVPGGTLVVEWEGGDAVHLVGPAVRVFDTEVSI